MGTLRWSAGSTLLAALLIAGCGGAGSPASSPSSPARPAASVLKKQIVAAVDGASSVHVSGTGTTQQNGPVESLDMTLTRAGGFSGTIGQGHQSITVVSTGSTVYVKISRTFLRQAKLPVSACARVCGKWIKLPARSAQALTGAISMNEFFGSMNMNATFRYAGTAIINGTPAWKLVDVTGGASGYVARQGPPYPLRVLLPRGQQGQFDFTQWNTAILMPLPSGSQIVTLSQIVNG